MRLAVPFDHGQIYGHFGRTAQFKLYDVTDGRIVSSAIVDTMGSGHGRRHRRWRAAGAGGGRDPAVSGRGGRRGRRGPGAFGRGAPLPAGLCLRPPQGRAAARVRQPYLLCGLLS